MSWTPRVVRGGLPDDGGPSDAELVRLTREGRDLEGRPPAPPGAEPFELLVRRHEAVVLRVARNITGTAEDARDVAQEAFLRAFRSLGTYRPERPFRSWILAIAANAARDCRARRTRDETDALASVPEPVQPGEGVEQADARVLLGQVREALAELAPREREVFVLRELEGLDVDAVAEILELAPPTVRRHLARARLALRRLLAGRGAPDPDEPPG